MEKALGSKIYYTISEVSDLVNLKPYTLRAWEREFSCLRPRRMGGKNRAYRNKDIGIVLLIKRLIYNERFTTQGVVKKLKDYPELIQQAESEFINRIQSYENSKDLGGTDKETADALILLANEEEHKKEIDLPAKKNRDWLDSTRQEIRNILSLLTSKESN